MLSTDFAWRRFVVNPPPGTIKRLINYPENPFLSSTMLAVIEAAREEDEEEFNHIYLGVPNDDDDSSVIKRSWIMAAVDAHVKLKVAPTGTNRVGFDVADQGKDKNATITARGSLAVSSDQWKAGEDELLKSATRARATCIENDAELIYDSIGVGAGVGAKVNELNKPGETVKHTGFNAGGGVIRPKETYARSHPLKTNQDMFSNAKAQAWWYVADRFRNTYNAVKKDMVFDQSDLIFIDGDMPNLSLLIDELCTPKRDFDNTGKVKVESKKDLAKSTRKGGAQPSPNLADAFIMAFAPVGGPTAFDMRNLL
jgi:phage terminase large subunit